MELFRLIIILDELPRALILVAVSNVSHANHRATKNDLVMWVVRVFIKHELHGVRIVLLGCHSRQLN